MKGIKKMEEKIKAIVEKVRMMYKYSNEYKSLVNMDAKVVLSEDKTSGFKIERICFDYYDRIVVCSNGISYHPEHGSVKTLMSYNSFDELLSM